MTLIKEVLRIAVMGVKFFNVMVPLEDMMVFMDANTMSEQYLQFYLYETCTQKGSKLAYRLNDESNGVLFIRCIVVI